MVVRWKFTDPVTSTITEFDVNANDGGSAPLERNISAHSTVAEGGATILFEGNESVQEINFSGIIRTQTAYNNLVFMFTKRHQIELTDDLSRTFMIFITKFDPKRVRSRHYPWKHTYSVAATIVDWP